jgi:hypothetical protein
MRLKITGYIDYADIPEGKKDPSHPSGVTADYWDSDLTFTDIGDLEDIDIVLEDDE